MVVRKLLENFVINTKNHNYDKIICLAVLEHVYDPFKAIENLRSMLKENGIIYGFVPYLYKYHAPMDLKYQDYFRREESF